MSTASIDSIRIECWDEALRNYGTGYIFERRANRYRWWLRGIQFLGLVGPLAIGAIALSWRQSSPNVMDYAIVVASIIGVIQLILTLWSLISRWDDQYSYALEALSVNYRLAEQFEKLGRNPPFDAQELNWQFAMLQTQNQTQTARDIKQGLSEKEKRRGMNAGLRKFQRKCAGCDQVPSSMKASDCDICGNF